MKNEKLDLIDLHIRPRGVIPIWILISIGVLIAKVFGAPIPWIATIIVPLIGYSLLFLLLTYAIMEAAQKDAVWLWRKLTNEEYDEE